MQIKNKKHRYILAGVLALILLISTIRYITYNGNENNKTEQSEVSLEETTSSDGILLSDMELNIFKDLYKNFSEENYNEVANIIINNAEILEEIWEKNTDNKAYYFDKENLSSEIKSGKLLAMKSENLFFYGDFVDGLPSGTAIAFNAYIADSERYEYSKGNFNSGILSGEAELGTVTIGAVDENVYKSNIRTGILENDAFNGDVVIKLIDAKDNSYTYNINVLDGVINITESWIYNQKDAKYRLQSNEDDKKYYIIDESKISDKRWVNKLLWK